MGFVFLLNRFLIFFSRYRQVFIYFQPMNNYAENIAAKSYMLRLVQKS